MTSLFSLSAYSYHAANSIKRDIINTKSGLYPLIISDINDRKKSDTIFILGSGDSINKITDKQWDLIEKHDSIGFNFWLLHDFVPDYYKFELDLTNKDIRYDIFINTIKDKWDFFSNKVLIYNHYQSFKKIPKIICEKMKDVNFYYPRYLYIPGRSTNVFEKNLKIYHNSFLKSKSVLFSKIGSLSMIVSFSLMMGYKNIVFCGVDLNNSKYFHDEMYYQKKYPGINGDTPGPVHMSYDPRLNSLTIDKVIKIVYNVMMINSNTNFYVLNSSSALYPSIPLYS